MFFAREAVKLPQEQLQPKEEPTENRRERSVLGFSRVPRGGVPEHHHDEVGSLNFVIWGGLFGLELIGMW